MVVALPCLSASELVSIHEIEDQRPETDHSFEDRVLKLSCLYKARSLPIQQPTPVAESRQNSLVNTEAYINRPESVSIRRQIAPRESGPPGFQIHVNSPSI